MSRPRLKSRQGCIRCKERHRKCDEVRPSCSFCRKRGVECSWSQDGGGQQLLRSTISLRRNPQTLTYRNHSERDAIGRAPSSVLAFYGPLCGQEVRDLRLLWQMLQVDHLLYDATVACFSLVFGRTPHHGQLSVPYYCSALQQVRQRVSLDSLGGSELLALQTTVFFLGLMDSVGPEQPSDLLLHWRGLAQLLAHGFKANLARLSSLQKNIFILVLEAAAYHLSCQMLFVEDARTIWKLWHETRIYEMLEESNPEGPQRITHSPLLCGCGDYVVYDLVVQLTYLSQASTSQQIATSKLDDIESTLCQLELSLESRLAQHQSHKLAATEVYRMFLGALFIQMTSLRECSRVRNETIDVKTSEVFEAFSEIRSADMNHAPTVWPVQILVCAIRAESEFLRFKGELTEFKLHLDPGHSRRLQAVVEEVECVRLAAKNAPKQLGATILPALGLLRKPGGILS